VWADFHSLDHAFQRASLRAAFLQLPRGAVEHLVRSPELRSVSENAVFLAVASWLRARVRDAAGGGDGGDDGGDAAAAAAADALQLLRLVRGGGAGAGAGLGLGRAPQRRPRLLWLRLPACPSCTLSLRS
jgi:hypothetical protein